jgi:hypothetical protein
MRSRALPKKALSLWDDETMMTLPSLSARWVRTCGGAFALVAALMATPAVRAAEAAPPCANCAAEQTLPSADIVPDAPATSPVPPNDPAVQARPPGCAEWTDRCVVCRRDAGKIACSNIGIACQPQAVECVRAEPAEEKKQGN